ncbi:acetylcholinesterase type 1 [Brachionus plicatilis]|uniref:Acetylcholinesterase type 1 n=1 Tax=Brachionus plicatilis TaxID=10195 RepID=A0A3M7PCK9_BRAPC|nr:acetylcholinesterase type 1 [Brachionus plicatilis]
MNSLLLFFLLFVSNNFCFNRQIREFDLNAPREGGIEFNVNSINNNFVNENHFSAHKHHNPNRVHHTYNSPDDDDNGDLLVETQNGKIKGRAFYLDYHLPKSGRSRHYPYGKKKYQVNAWLGIPYAEKPIGDLRFKRPVPIKNWDDVMDVTELPNSCYQLHDTLITGFDGVEMWNPNTNVSEDCLYLNIWSPHPKPKNSAVMVWIYGGGFTSGTATLKIYDPKIIVAETQTIIVSIQYRLSIFGFLYMDDEKAPGNQGLIDQYLALKWIQNNIQYFGGDSSKITLFGESAGSVSVSLHLLSPLSSNLFHNAIMESGTALADWTLLNHEDAMKRSTGILKKIGCKGTTPEMIECAKKVNARTALEQSDEYFYSRATHGVAQFIFVPVVDKYFLEEEPISLLNRGKFKKCPILLGGNRDEGNWLFVYAFPEYRNLTTRPAIDYGTFKDFMTSLFYFYPQYPDVSSLAIRNAILYRYTNWNNVHNEEKNFENLDDAAGDFHFLCPTIDFANIYAISQIDVYFYYYTQRSSNHYWPEWLGVMHGDEISFVFGEPLSPEKNYTYEEKILARKMLKYWSNFAKYSNPNGPVTKSERGLNKRQNLTIEIEVPRTSSLEPVATQTLLQPIEYWPKYQVHFDPKDNNQRAHLTLNSEKVEIGYNLRAEYCAFWGSFLPKLILGEARCNCGACLYNYEKHKELNSNTGAKTPYQNTALIIFFVFRVILA